MPPDSVLSHHYDRAAEMLEALDVGGFKAMLSLEKIVVVHGVYDMDEMAIAFRESLMQRMPSCKWSIKLIKLSDDGRIEFDSHEECTFCNNENEFWSMEMMEEEQWWEEEYYFRRDDPFWSNDSDCYF